MTPKDYQQFGLYAKDKGISSLKLDYYNQKVENSLTPYILEERSLNVTVMDVFSRLMMERIIWVAGGVDDHMSTIVQAQLMFLDSIDSNVFVILFMVIGLHTKVIKSAKRLTLSYRLNWLKN